jgi:hypothetical protein
LVATLKAQLGETETIQKQLSERAQKKESTISDLETTKEGMLKLEMELQGSKEVAMDNSQKEAGDRDESLYEFMQKL